MRCVHIFQGMAHHNTNIFKIKVWCINGFCPVFHRLWLVAKVGIRTYHQLLARFLIHPAHLSWFFSRICLFFFLKKNDYLFIISTLNQSSCHFSHLCFDRTTNPSRLTRNCPLSPAANSVVVRTKHSLYLRFHVSCVLFRLEKTQLKIHAGIFRSSFSLYNRPWEAFRGPTLPTLKSSPRGGLNMPAAFQWCALHPLSSLLFSSNHLFFSSSLSPLIALHPPSLCSIFSAKLSILSETIHIFPAPRINSSAPLGNAKPVFLLPLHIHQRGETDIQRVTE